jgi:hypothetical protein
METPKKILFGGSFFEGTRVFAAGFNADSSPTALLNWVGQGP